MTLGEFHSPSEGNNGVLAAQRKEQISGLSKNHTAAWIPNVILKALLPATLFSVVTGCS